MLETKIAALTKAVEDLTAVLQAQQTAPVAVAQPVEPERVEAPEPAPVVEDVVTVTRDSLQEWALGKVREDKTFKDNIMAALKARGVKTISQLPDDAVAAEVFAELGGEL